MVTIFFHALWALCVLGGVVLTAVSVKPLRWATLEWRSSLSLAIGFAVAIWRVHPQHLPEPAIVASLTALIAAIHLVKPKYAFLTAMFGGFLAGLTAPLLEVFGVPALLAVPAAALPPAITVLLSFWLPRFAPIDVKEEALLGLIGFSVISALAPGLAAGWQSALALNIEAKNSVNFAVPGWTLTLGAISIALGGAYAVWRRQ